ncbi:MAG: uracil-DNA glycosylase family protein [Bacteroidia bacterium]|nr:uracil-DNA glycosylase family protein [Bacteroidia bacterium]NNF29855.1 uracil-DNA glycosylase family protein [Flavobacteriaceae bacterium]MBT8275762.1 uracil-DNA glycosylase family protein [Bacteroidia bacterium]NNJ81488.1 uracil-DNA glycosylase family protein [Flavobacteriaceae bacterium]NNK54188.1 uracil-DNA glycosylase family protein [Flavobacteriaceae bacterium]
MFLHTHPYKPFIPKNSRKLIVGTLPPPRFTTGELREGDVNFCYGSRDGQLWPILNRIFKLDLPFETTEIAVEKRKKFLLAHQIGICDIVESARREKIDASDIGMKDVQLRELLTLITRYPKIDTLLFMGGNSKNGPEYFFRRLLKKYDLNLKPVSSEVPRIHEFLLPASNRVIRTISLIAPSGAANRAVGSLQKYKDLKNKNPEMTTVDFRVLQYSEFFKN